jgi:gamma-glutamylcyclotransferase (GGCT)/AIG2-like uncharacterized protein YtfP
MKDYLFAYGTLIEKSAPRAIAATIKHLKPIGDGFIFARLYDLGEYPGAVLDGSHRYKVFGKILEIPANGRILERLDEYEGFNRERPDKSLFLRKRAIINRTHRSNLEGWIYEYNGNVGTASLIKSGHYTKVAA